MASREMAGTKRDEARRERLRTARTAEFSALIEELRYRVGDIYTTVVATNPATTLGYGTWTAFGPGRVLVGVDTGDAAFDTVEETGGAKTVASAGTVAAPTMSGALATESSHTHNINVLGADEGAITEGTSIYYPKQTDQSTSAGSAHTHGLGTLAASPPAFTGSATSVLQPYITVYRWIRTA